VQRPAQSTRQPRHHQCRSLARPRCVAQTGGHWTKQREGHGRWHRNFGCRSGTQNAQACPCAPCPGCLHLPLCPGLPPQVQQHELLPGSWRLGVVRPTWVLRVVCRMLDDGCLVTDGVHRHGQRLPRKATCIGHCFTTTVGSLATFLSSGVGSEATARMRCLWQRRQLRSYALPINQTSSL